MALKIFIPDYYGPFDRHSCSPMAYPFLPHLTITKDKVNQYGAWINRIKIVNTIDDCDIVLVMHTINHLYKFKKASYVQELNNRSISAGKLLVCCVKGDAGITPDLHQFHLYRWGGYASKNKGNQFVMPVFIADPVLLYQPNAKTFFHTKSSKPFVGFCGQGLGGRLKFGTDLTRNLLRRLCKTVGLHPYDNEAFISSTYIRSSLLDIMENSTLIDALFIRWRRYRGGATTPAEQEEGSRVFFDNVFRTQYTICYRGAGNFSVRLFETLAAGRIPIIIKSDNNLPLPHLINWNRFPVVEVDEIEQIDKVVFAFHNKLSNEDFIELQKYARHIWECYLTYQSYMNTIVESYTSMFDSNRVLLTHDVYGGIV